MNKIIHLSERLRCNQHRAFTYFTSNSLLESWLTAVADIQPIVGGKYELFWQPDDRENNSTIGCRVTAVAPNMLIAFEWKSPKQYKRFANNADPLTHVVVSFIPIGNETIVHLVHSGWRSTPLWEKARVWQEEAWTSALVELRQQINGDM